MKMQICTTIENNPIPIMIGARISQRRKSMKITQTDFANILGKSLRTVQKYENGGIDMPLSVLCKTADALKIPVSALFENTEYIERTEESEEVEADGIQS